RPSWVQNLLRVEQIARSALRPMSILPQTITVKISSSHTQVIILDLQPVLRGIYIAVEIKALALEIIKLLIVRRIVRTGGQILPVSENNRICSSHKRSHILRPALCVPDQLVIRD